NTTRSMVRRTDGRHGGNEPARGGIEQERSAENHALEDVGHEHGRTPRNANQQHGHQRDEAGNRPGYGDVEQRATIRERTADADDRAEGAGERRGRYEVGKARVDAVSPADRGVSERVGAEDGEHSAGIPDADRPGHIGGGAT